MTTQTDIGAAHGRAMEQARSIIAGIRADQMTKTTPCTKWNVRELANHLVGSTLVLAAVGNGETVGRPDVAEDRLGDDPARAYDAARRSLLEVFASPGALERPWALPIGEVPGTVARNIGVVETVAHSWDLAKATGQLERLDPELAEVTYGIATAMLQPDFRKDAGDPFAPAIDVAEDAPVYERLAGFLGRKP